MTPQGEYWELTPGPPEEQQALLTAKPSLQSWITNFNVKMIDFLTWDMKVVMSSQRWSTADIFLLIGLIRKSVSYSKIVSGSFNLSLKFLLVCGIIK